MFEKYLITGATGFLGCAVLAQLRDSQAEIRALVMDGDPLTRELPQNVRVMTGDVCDEAALERFFAGADEHTCVIHCAGIISVATHQRRYPSGFYEITMNADGTIQEIGQRGIVEDAGISVQQYVQQAVAEGASRGKIGSYKYDIAFQADGTAHIILLDISIQLQSLYNMLKSALMVGGILSVALLLILIPVSGRVAGAFMRNAEKQKQFITDAGHDLKTPIAIMRSNLDVMELLQGKSQWTENLRSQITRLERLVAQLMMMARLEEMRESGAAEEIALSAMLREQWQGYAAQTALKQIDANAEIEDGMRVRSRGETLRQMINLLMDNAVQYTDAHGSIRLSAKREKRKIRLCLCNSVDHLPSQPPEALTGRFVRGDGARNQKNGGAGIGLAEVKRIVDIHGGRLEIRYQGDHLFCVQVDLPAA